MRYDICTLRAAAILAIVLHHSALYVCANALGTETFSPLHMDDFTRHVCWLCKVIGLGLFTFISGALLRMQMPRLTSRRAFIIKKIRRIAIPSAVMAVAYALCFPSMSFNVGGLYLCQAHTHLWYLPFIFMALVLTYLVKPDLSPAGIIKIAALLVATRLYSVYVPLYSFNMCVYYPVFLAGYLFSDLKLNRLAQIGGGDDFHRLVHWRAARSTSPIRIPAHHRHVDNRRHGRYGDGARPRRRAPRPGDVAARPAVVSHLPDTPVCHQLHRDSRSHERPGMDVVARRVRRHHGREPRPLRRLRLRLLPPLDYTKSAQTDKHTQHTLINPKNYG